MHQKTEPLILAVDTSCDDTAAAVLRGSVILSNVIASQTQLHKQYGGVFPTVAKQAHRENIIPTIMAALKAARLPLEGREFGEKNAEKVETRSATWQDLDALAVTVGPGLAPALEVGITTIKNLAQEKNLPVIAVNHIEGHALSALALKNSGTGKEGVFRRAQPSPESQPQLINYPVLSIVVSGGHTEFIYFEKIGSYQILGSTIDDAAGECLDKIGRMLNLGYPAGAIIEKFAKLGNPKAVEFPLPMTMVKTYNMSFSGLKTFARNYLQKKTEKNNMTKQEIYDFCASVQYSVFRHITYKLSKLLEEVPVREIWLGGGVAQNALLRQTIRETIKNFEQDKQSVMQKKAGETMQTLDKSVQNNIQQTAKQSRIIFRFPHTKRLCMDNAAMIGLVASFKFERGEFVTDLETLDRKPRWKVGERLI